MHHPNPHHAYLRTALFGGIALVMLLLSYTARNATTGLHLFPLFDVAVIYVGIVYFRMPLWLVGALGLLRDILCGIPFGCYGLTNMLAKLVLDRQINLIHAQSFAGVWGCFAIFMLIHTALYTLIIGITLYAMPQMMPLMAGYAISVLAYPMFHASLLWIDGSLEEKANT